MKSGLISPSQLLASFLGKEQDKIGQGIARSDFAGELKKFLSPDSTESTVPQTLTTDSSKSDAKAVKAGSQTPSDASAKATDAPTQNVSTTGKKKSAPSDAKAMIKNRKIKAGNAEDLTVTDPVLTETILSNLQCPAETIKACKSIQTKNGSISIKDLKTLLDSQIGTAGSTSSGQVSAEQVRSLLASISAKGSGPGQNASQSLKGNTPVAVKTKPDGSYTLSEFSGLLDQVLQQETQGSEQKTIQSQQAKTASNSAGGEITGQVAMGVKAGQTGSLAASELPPFLSEDTEDSTGTKTKTTDGGSLHSEETMAKLSVQGTAQQNLKKVQTVAEDAGKQTREIIPQLKQAAGYVNPDSSTYEQGNGSTDNESRFFVAPVLTAAANGKDTSGSVLSIDDIAAMAESFDAKIVSSAQQTSIPEGGATETLLKLQTGSAIPSQDFSALAKETQKQTTGKSSQGDAETIAVNPKTARAENLTAPVPSSSLSEPAEDKTGSQQKDGSQRSSGSDGEKPVSAGTTSSSAGKGESFIDHVIPSSLSELAEVNAGAQPNDASKASVAGDAQSTVSAVAASENSGKIKNIVLEDGIGQPTQEAKAGIDRLMSDSALKGAMNGTVNESQGETVAGNIQPQPQTSADASSTAIGGLVTGLNSEKLASTIESSVAHIISTESEVTNSNENDAESSIVSPSSSTPRSQNVAGLQAADRTSEIITTEVGSSTAPSQNQEHTKANIASAQAEGTAVLTKNTTQTTTSNGSPQIEGTAVLPKTTLQTSTSNVSPRVEGTPVPGAWPASSETLATGAVSGIKDLDATGSEAAGKLLSADKTSADAYSSLSAKISSETAAQTSTDSKQGQVESLSTSSVPSFVSEDTKEAVVSQTRSAVDASQQQKEPTSSPITVEESSKRPEAAPQAAVGKQAGAAPEHTEEPAHVDNGNFNSSTTPARETQRNGTASPDSNVTTLQNEAAAHNLSNDDSDSSSRFSNSPTAALDLEKSGFIASSVENQNTARQGTSIPVQSMAAVVNAVKETEKQFSDKLLSPETAGLQNAGSRMQNDQINFAPMEKSPGDAQNYYDPNRAAELIQNYRDQMRTASAGQLTLEMEPEGFGKLSIKVGTKKDEITAQIVTDNDSARQALLKNSPELRQDLQNQGLALGKFNVDVGSDRPGSGGNLPEWLKPGVKETPAAKVREQDRPGVKPVYTRAGNAQSNLSIFA